MTQRHRCRYHQTQRTLKSREHHRRDDTVRHEGALGTETGSTDTKAARGDRDQPRLEKAVKGKVRLISEKNSHGIRWYSHSGYLKAVRPLLVYFDFHAIS